jgi:hypothetical protein
MIESRHDAGHRAWSAGDDDRTAEDVAVIAEPVPSKPLADDHTRRVRPIVAARQSSAALRRLAED